MLIIIITIYIYVWIGLFNGISTSNELFNAEILKYTSLAGEDQLSRFKAVAR